MCLQGAGGAERYGLGEDGKVHEHQNNLNNSRYARLRLQASRPLCWTLMRDSKDGTGESSPAGISLSPKQGCERFCDCAIPPAGIASQSRSWLAHLGP